MSKREDHTFKFKAIEISAAAEKHAIYHEQRLKFWEKE